MKQNLILLTVLLTAFSAFCAEYFVDASRSDDSGAATNWETAKKTIQAAVDLTTDNDTVWVTNGVYDTGGSVTPGYSLTNRVCITNGITVCSLNGPEVTIIQGVADPVSTNGPSAVRCVYLTTNAGLSGFTLTGGHTMAENAAVYDQGGGVYLLTNAVVSNCVITANGASGDGAGAYLYQGGTLAYCVLSGNRAGIGGGGAFLCQGGVLNNCTVSGNYARAAGGAYCWNGGRLDNCLLTDNVATNGGGVFLRGGVLLNSTLSENRAVYGGGAQMSLDAAGYGCSFINNRAEYGGGAHLEADAVLSLCTLSRNTANYGGGVRFWTATGSVENCVLAGNSANYFGGGVDLRLGGILNHCTVSGNSASNGGGGIRLADSGTMNGGVVWSNVSTGAKDILYISGSNNVIRYTCASDGVTNGVDGCITNNPLFVDGVNSNFHLQAGSPCINAGHNSDVSATNDLDGNPRIVGGVADMGAYERQDASLDFDADGMDDLWEMENFSSRYSANPNTVCSNGVNTLLEAYVAGLDPKDPNSKFLMSVRQSSPPAVLEWNATSGRVYSVYFSTNLLNGFQSLETNITAGIYTDLVHSAGQGFYRIDVRKP